MNPKVSIIILNWNGMNETIECLESLKKVIYPNYEVIVVDNGSKGDDVSALRQRFGEYVQIIENDKNYGFAEGNNIGIRYALKNSRPDYILLLNNDTKVASESLAELVNVAESDPLIGITGPKVYWYDKPRKIQSVGGRINWWTGEVALLGGDEVDNGQFDRIKDVDWVTGAGLLIKCGVIEKIGLLYPMYFTYFEEVEWCVRCKKAGYRVVYVPDAKLWHKLASAIDRIDGMRLYYMTRNRFLFMKRNATRLQFACFLLRFFARDFFRTTISLLVWQRSLRALAKFYHGAGSGICCSISHIREGDET